MVKNLTKLMVFINPQGQVLQPLLIWEQPSNTGVILDSVKQWRRRQEEEQQHHHHHQQQQQPQEPQQPQQTTDNPCALLTSIVKIIVAATAAAAAFAALPCEHWINSHQVFSSPSTNVYKYCQHEGQGCVLFIYIYMCVHHIFIFCIYIWICTCLRSDVYTFSSESMAKVG